VKASRRNLQLSTTQRCGVLLRQFVSSVQRTTKNSLKPLYIRIRLDSTQMNTAYGFPSISGILISRSFAFIKMHLAVLVGFQENSRRWPENLFQKIIFNVNSTNRNNLISTALSYTNLSLITTNFSLILFFQIKFMENSW
jgi:hypothetical protein